MIGTVLSSWASQTAAADRYEARLDETGSREDEAMMGVALNRAVEAEDEILATPGDALAKLTVALHHARKVAAGEPLDRNWRLVEAALADLQGETVARFERRSLGGLAGFPAVGGSVLENTGRHHA